MACLIRSRCFHFESLQSRGISQRVQRARLLHAGAYLRNEPVVNSSVAFWLLSVAMAALSTRMYMSKVFQRHAAA
jgi:hypothetical protein